MVQVQLSRAYKGCKEGRASKDTANHTNARRRCEAWTQWTTKWGRPGQFDYAKSQLRLVYARGCDTHKLAMECGKFVRGASAKLSSDQIAKDKRYKAFRALASKQCVAKDATACMAVLSLLPAHPQLVDPVMNVSYKALVIKHAQQTCQAKKTQASCLPFAVVSGGSKNWGVMEALCERDKNPGACAQLAAHTRRAHVSQAWSDKACAMGHGPSCAKLAKAPKQWRVACAYAQLSACQRLLEHVNVIDKNE